MLFILTLRQCTVGIRYSDFFSRTFNKGLDCSDATGRDVISSYLTASFVSHRYINWLYNYLCERLITVTQ